MYRCGHLPPTTLGQLAEALPIEIGGKGSYAQFHTFLESLENLERPVVGGAAID